jgi:hypothetical protein
MNILQYPCIINNMTIQNDYCGIAFSSFGWTIREQFDFHVRHLEKSGAKIKDHLVNQLSCLSNVKLPMYHTQMLFLWTQSEILDCDGPASIVLFCQSLAVTNLTFWILGLLDIPNLKKNPLLFSMDRAHLHKNISEYPIFLLYWCISPQVH